MDYYHGIDNEETETFHYGDDVRVKNPWLYDNTYDEVESFRYDDDVRVKNPDLYAKEAARVQRDFAAMNNVQTQGGIDEYQSQMPKAKEHGQ